MDILHPLKASNTLPQTHNGLNDYYQFNFLEAVRKGEQEPFVWPYRCLGTYVLLAYLLLPPTQSRVVRLAVYPVYAFFAYWSILAIIETRSASFGITYLIGIGNAWAVLWMACRVLFTDFRTARRVERRSSTSNETAVSVSQDSNHNSISEQDNELRRRANGTSHTEDKKAVVSSSTPSERYYWQTLPAQFLPRLDFIVDLLCSMRGPGWQHQARSIPGPPKYIASQLDPPPPSIKSVVQGYEDRSTVVRTNVLRFLRYELYLDIIKTIMCQDPYFLGFVDPTPPAPTFLPLFVQNSPVLTKWWRLLLGMFGTRIALGMIFCLSPMFLSGLLGPRILGLRAEAWYYSDFEAGWRYLLSDGIAGWWGAWWHQIFRLGFETPSKWICQKLGLSQKSNIGKIVTLLVVFSCSGLVHASGAMCALSETKPWSGAFLFFLLQAFGVFLEAVVRKALINAGIAQRTPRAIRNIFVVTYMATWAYYTGPLLIDDFTRARVWLFEPVPISISKMLGFGEPNDHWWRWKARNVFWHTGDRWWKSGIAF